jgi:hypothetical protein
MGYFMVLFRGFYVSTLQAEIAKDKKYLEEIQNGS